MKAEKIIGFGVLLWIFMMVWMGILLFAFGIQGSIEQLSAAPLIIHLVLLVVITSLLTKAYYNSRDKMDGFGLGFSWVVIAAILDLILTIPLYIIANGGSYAHFFSNPWVWIGWALVILVAGFTREIVRR